MLTARAAVALVVLAAAGCRRDAGEVVTYDRPNVVLVTLDTVRPDRLGSYGHDRPTSPNLDRLAREAARFTHAFAQSSFTPASHASLLTSRYVASHGVRWWNYRLPAEVVTLAEAFRDAGWATASFSPLAMGSLNALDQGFERVVEMRDEGDFRLRVDDDPANDYRIAPAAAINERVFRWLDERDERPFLAWIHYYDAHRPYGVFAGERPFSADPDGRFGNAQSDYRLTPAVRARRGIDASHAAALIDRYDDGLRALDREVGRLLDRLAADGTLDRTILVVTADHGEAFDEFEAEWFTHDPFLYDAVTRVPLFLRLPDRRFAGAAVDGLVELVDVAPTLLDYAGVERPFGMQGHALRPLLEGGRELRTFAAAERQGRDRDDREGRTFGATEVGRRRSLRFAGARLVVELSDGRFTLYDRAAEAHERTDRWDPEGVRADAVRAAYGQAVQRIEALQPTMDPTTLSDEQRAVLEQLGYL